MQQNAMDTRAYNEMKSVMGSVLHDLIATFLEYMPAQIEDLNQAINDGNADLIFSIAHRIKSSSSSLGALGLAETAETIEQIGREGNTDGAGEHFNALRTQLEEVMVFLNKELEQV